MNRLISDILDAPEPGFSHALQSWEAKNGRKGHDVRLISDISTGRKKAIGELGLDENDTTPSELFYTLRHKAATANDSFVKTIGAKPEDSPEELLNKLVKYIESLEISRDVWTIKHPVIKQLLKKQPPKKLMKTLGLRSVDSMLKRINSYELLSIAYRVESSEWTQKMHGQLKKLTPSDFQSGKSCIFVVDTAKADKLRKAGFQSSNLILPNYETGTVLMLPSSKRFNLDALTLALTLLQVLHDLRIYSAYFRHISVKGGFGLRLHKVLHDGLPGSINSGQIGWRAIQRHMSRNPDSFHKIEQPHLQYEDIAVAHPGIALAKKVPDLVFWGGKQHLFLLDGKKPVSMHLMDVVLNASNQLDYDRSSHHYLRAHLWDELGSRYLEDEPILAMVVEDIEKDGDIV
jgi:hypothetical protein